MKRRKHVMLWIRLMVLCLPLIMAASCADTSTSGMRMYLPADTLVQSYEMVDHGKDLDLGKLTPLSNTKWRVTSINPKPQKGYASMVLIFQPDGNLVQTTVYPDRSEKSETFRYYIIGSTLLINKPKCNVNARFKIEGGILAIDTVEAGMILEPTK
jgi:hypothetical protein